MTGSGNWAIDGGGTLLMAHTLATQTYTGFLIVKNGSTLEFQAGGAIDSGLGGTPKSGGAWVQLSGGSRLKFDLTSSGGTNFSGSARDISVSGSGTIEVTPTNTVINTGGITGSGTLSKDGTGLYSLRTSNTYSGKWNVLQGTLEFGAPTNNALSLGTGSGADFVTIQNGATLRMTSTATSGTMGATQGITLAGASTSIDVATGTTLSVPGDITAGTGKTLNKIGLGTLKIKNFRGDTLNISAGNVGILPNSTATGTSVVSTLTTGANKLDLTDNKLIITTPGKTGTFTGGVYTETAGLVAAGRNPTGGGVPQWNAAGIITSQTAALGTMASTIAVASASDVGKTSFGGQNVNPTDTLVMYTWNGDANMTGKVDADDYFIIDSNYNKNGTLYGFSKGDFNYDGKINGDDYAMIDAGYINQGTPISAGATLDGGLPGGVSAVPEPGSFALLSLGAMSVLGRRRRSR
jgi:autotransporter-associated beta strand protein